LTAEVRRSEPRYTDLELSVYGHVGDGDLHYNVLVPPEVDRIEFTKRIESGLSLQLYDTAAALGGTLARSTASVGSRSIFLNHRAAKATGRFPRSIDTDRTHTRRLAGAPALAYLRSQGRDRRSNDSLGMGTDRIAIGIGATTAGSTRDAGKTGNTS
jgi:hypothetical protein